MNTELILFPKGGHKITSICFMILDGEVPSDVVPTAWCHLESLNTHIHAPALSTVAQSVPTVARSCRSESFCGSCDTAQTIRESHHRAHSLSKQHRGVLTGGTVLASDASSPVAGSPVEIPRVGLRAVQLWGGRKHALHPNQSATTRVIKVSGKRDRSVRGNNYTLPRSEQHRNT